MEVHNIVQEAGIKTIPKKKKWKKAKWLFEERLQIIEKRSKRQRRKGKIYTSESSSKKLQGAIRKLSYVINAKKQRKTIEWERLEISWRRQWHPTPVLLPGKSRGQKCLVGCRLWGHTESDTTDVTWQQQQRSLKKLEIKLEN